MEEPDPRTIRAAAAGDVEAFTALVRAAQPHVWRFLRHLTGNDDEAADLTQETFVRMHGAIARFRFQSRFTTWLLRIARNAAFDEQRRNARRRARDETAASAATVPGPSLGAELRAAVASLPALQREAFVLVEVFGLGYREAGEVLGVPVGTVKSRVFTARERLVAWFGETDAGGLTEDGRGGA